MGANVLPLYDRNPYRADHQQQQLVIFSGSELNYLVRGLSPVALRVLLVLASKLTGEGYAKASLDDLARFIRSPRSYINKGILQLADYDIITKKNRSEYWINPSVFRPASIEIS